MDSVTDKRRPKRTGQRGPVEHQRREQIIRAAEQHIHQVGYRRTSVVDLARAIGFSTAYIYKFFDSKRAIGEAICAMTLGGIDEALWAIAEGPGSAEARLGHIYKALADQGRALYFNDRQLHEITLVAVEERWSSVGKHVEALRQIIRRIVLDGREAGGIRAQDADRRSGGRHPPDNGAVLPSGPSPGQAGSSGGERRRRSAAGAAQPGAVTPAHRRRERAVRFPASMEPRNGHDRADCARPVRNAQTPRRTAATLVDVVAAVK